MKVGEGAGAGVGVNQEGLFMTSSEHLPTEHFRIDCARPTLDLGRQP